MVADRSKDPAWDVVEEFDEVLFDLCRSDDYAGIYREMAKRLGDCWQPIETAPKDGTWVLLCGGRTGEDFCDQEHRPVTAHWVSVDIDFPSLNSYPNANFWAVAFWDGSWFTSYEGATHWRPLLAPIQA